MAPGIEISSEAIPVQTQSKVEALLLTSSRALASRIRILLYRMLGMSVGRQCRFEKIRARNLRLIAMGDNNALTEGCWLWPMNLGQNRTVIQIGNSNYFNRDVMVDSCGRVEIGNFNMIGPRVYITDSNHSTAVGTPPGDLPMDAGRVKIGNRCWIGAHAVILKDVELGDDCVVGAGAVVTHSFPCGSVIAGVPARLIRRREQ